MLRVCRDYLHVLLVMQENSPSTAYFQILPVELLQWEELRFVLAVLFYLLTAFDNHFDGLPSRYVKIMGEKVILVDILNEGFQKYRSALEPRVNFLIPRKIFILHETVDARSKIITADFTKIERFYVTD